MRNLAFHTYSDKRLLYYQFSQLHLYLSLWKVGRRCFLNLGVNTNYPEMWLIKNWTGTERNNIYQPSVEPIMISPSLCSFWILCFWGIHLAIIFKLNGSNQVYVLLMHKIFLSIFTSMPFVLGSHTYIQTHTGTPGSPWFHYIFFSNQHAIIQLIVLNQLHDQLACVFCWVHWRHLGYFVSWRWLPSKIQGWICGGWLSNPSRDPLQACCNLQRTEPATERLEIQSEKVQIECWFRGGFYDNYLVSASHEANHRIAKDCNARMGSTVIIFNHYSLKWRWIAVDIYQAALAR